MGRAIRVELRHALGNRWFALALGAGCLLALVPAFRFARHVETVMRAYQVYGSQEDHGITVLSAFVAWVGVSTDAASELLFTLLPLFVLMPYALAVRSELLNGFALQGLMRSGRTRWYVAKGVGAFVSGGLVAAAPLLLGLVASLCAAPARTPVIQDSILLRLNVASDSPLSVLYYNAPLAYVLAWVGIDFVLCGLWSLCILAVSLVVQNRIVLVAGAYLAQMALGVLPQLAVALMGAPDAPAPHLDLFWLLNPTGIYLEGQSLVTAAAILLMVVVSVGVPWACRQRDAL